MKPGDCEIADDLLNYSIQQGLSQFNQSRNPLWLTKKKKKSSLDSETM